MATSALQAICIVLIARQAGPTRFGHFALGLALAAIVGAVFGFGTTTRALRILREPHPVVMASSLTVIRLASMSAGAVAVFVVMEALGERLWGAAAIAVVAAVDHYCDFEQSMRAGFLEHRGSVMVLVYQRGLPLVAVLSAFLIGVDCIGAYCTASIGVMCCILPRPLRRFDGTLDLKSAVSGSFGYWWGTISASVQQLDMVLVRLSTGAVGTGLYGAANKLTSPLGIIVNSAVVAFSPGFGQIEDPAERHHAFRRLVRVAVCYGAGVILVSPFLAVVVGDILGSEYRAARPIIIGVACASGIAASAQVIQSYLYIEGMASESARDSFVAVVLGLISLFIAGWMLGPQWLWAGLFVNYSILTGLLAIRFRRMGRLARTRSEVSQVIDLSGDDAS